MKQPTWNWYCSRSLDDLRHREGAPASAGSGGRRLAAGGGAVDLGDALGGDVREVGGGGVAVLPGVGHDAVVLLRPVSHGRHDDLRYLGEQREAVQGAPGGDGVVLGHRLVCGVQLLGGGLASGHYVLGQGGRRRYYPGPLHVPGDGSRDFGSFLRRCVGLS